MNNEILVAENVTKIYGIDTKNPVTALSDVSLTMYESDFICVMGPSGSGKSTFINNLSTIDIPTKGKVFINGQEVRTMGENEVGKFRYENLGFIFQEFNLLESLTIFENIAVPLTLSHVPLEEVKQRVQVIAKKLGVDELLDKYPSECSGGQRQRASIARALVTNPKLIVADEPTGNLDSKNSHDLLELFKRLNEEEGVSILMVTHDSMIASYSQKLLYIKDGQIAETIERKDLTQKELANYLNVSQKSYSRYERGERTIAPEILDKIATFHETTVDYLLGRTDDKTDYTKKENQIHR